MSFSTIGAPKSQTFPTTAYFIFIEGQSNANGIGEVLRLANSKYNYQGIADLYPVSRSNQTQYVTSSAGVYIYWKHSDQSFASCSADNGAWQQYHAGVNSNSSTLVYNSFGPELSLSQLIQQRTGKEVFIVKPAYDGTPLSTGVTGSNFGPGNWFDVTLPQVLPSLYSRALRDFKVFRPGVVPVPLVCLWHQGESDESATTTQHYLESATLFTDRNTTLIQSYFPSINKPILNAIIQLDMHRDSPEAIINAAKTQQTSFQANTVLILNTTSSINGGTFPRRSDLTTTECSPIAFDSSPDSSLDSAPQGLHASYIKQLAIGELVYKQLLSRGYI